jgi:hypothetical protein
MFLTFSVWTTAHTDKTECLGSIQTRLVDMFSVFLLCTDKKENEDGDIRDNALAHQLPEHQDGGLTEMEVVSDSCLQAKPCSNTRCQAVIASLRLKILQLQRKVCGYTNMLMKKFLSKVT